MQVPQLNFWLIISNQVIKEMQAEFLLTCPLHSKPLRTFLVNILVPSLPTPHRAHVWRIIEPLQGLCSTEADSEALESRLGSMLPVGEFILILLQMACGFSLPPTSSCSLFSLWFSDSKIS